MVDYSRLERLVLGDGAQRIVEELFKDMGYAVTRNGIENRIALARLELGERIPDEDDAGSPDLYVEGPDGSYHVEVKYRSKHVKEDIGTLKKYPNDTLVVFVSRELGGCWSDEYPTRIRRLGDVEVLSQHQEIINEYNRFCELYYKTHGALLFSTYHVQPRNQYIR